MNAMQAREMEASFKKAGAIGAMVFSGYISSEWKTRSEAEKAKAAMSKAGFVGCKVVANPDEQGSYYAKWSIEDEKAAKVQA